MKVPTLQSVALWACTLLHVTSPAIADDDDYVIDEEAEQRARAASLNSMAMEMAQAGNEADALFDFEEAVELDPTNSGFWTNFGVTQMRVGLLDEALDSFMTADELDPGSKLVQQNLKALQEHFDWRSKQSGEIQGSGEGEEL